MRRIALPTKILISTLIVLGVLPAMAEEPLKILVRDQAKFKRRSELERLADQASQANQRAREQEVVRVVPHERRLSQYLNSAAGTHYDMSEDQGLTVRQAMERRLARFEAALQDARKYRKDLPLNLSAGATERVVLDRKVDIKINYEAFKAATLRAISEYNAFDHYKAEAQANFRRSFGDLYMVPGDSRIMMGASSQSMEAFFNKYQTGVAASYGESDPEKLFRGIAATETGFVGKSWARPVRRTSR